MSEAESRHPWEYPDCPECGGHVFVGRATGREGDWWYCYRCSRSFADGGDA